jgi:hypothetical protein
MLKNDLSQVPGRQFVGKDTANAVIGMESLGILYNYIYNVW